MHSFTSAVVLATAGLASAGLVQRQSACSEVHVFLGKGNNEPYPGRQGKLVNAICAGLPSCDYEDILFYNPVEANYCASVTEGVSNGLNQITSYNARCPDSKLVISGYSQGAQVVSDILAGGGGVFFQGCVQPNSAQLDPNSAAGKKVAAAITFGNTRHTASQSYNALSGVNGQGLFPRTGGQLTAIARYSSVYQDWCVSNDPICAGGNVVEDHLNYFDVYTDQAAAWIKSKLAAVPDTPVAPTSSAQPTIQPTSTGPAPTAFPSYSPAYPLSNSTITVTAGPATEYVSCLPIPAPTSSVHVSVPVVSAYIPSTVSAASTIPATATYVAVPTYAPSAASNGTVGPKPTAIITNGAAGASAPLAMILAVGGAMVWIL